MALNIPNFILNFVTIAGSGTTSTAIDFQGRGLVALILPATFTGTGVSFQISPDGVTYYDCYNTANTLLSATVTQGRAYMFSPGDLVGIRYLKIVSNATEGGSRTLTLLSRELA